jgi:hypothetical protein
LEFAAEKNSVVGLVNIDRCPPIVLQVNWASLEEEAWQFVAFKTIVGLCDIECHTEE